MTDSSVLAAILDSLREPVLFADAEHVVRYMNKAAVAHFEEGKTLLGTSLFDCHNERSNETIVETFAAFQHGEDERLISENPEQRVYMRAVRDNGGSVIGYYERYEPRQVAP